jgi:peptide/nickel transport system substrate-binding protein
LKYITGLRKRLRSTVLFTSSFALLLGVVVAPASVTAANAASSTLVIGVPSFPGSWDQDYVGFDLVALSLYKNIYPYMIDYSVKTVAGKSIQNPEKIIPTFAKSFEADKSGKVWTLKLREGIKFPSGNELTSADVKWSKDRAFAAKANVAGVYRNIGLTESNQVVVVDKYTVRFDQTFANPMTPQIQAISLFVFDSVLVKSHATDSDPWAKAWVAKNPQDGGYYNVESFIQGQEIVLAANPQYPGADKALTQKIILKVIPASANMRLQLEKGDIDVALGLPSSDIAALKKDSKVNVISSPSNTTDEIQLNTNIAPLNNKLVRQAIAYAIPYESVRNAVYNGDARKAQSPFPIEMPGSTKKGYPYTFNLNKAKALMSKAGVSGLTTEFAYTSSDVNQARMGVLIRASLAQIGIKLKLTPLDPATLSSRRAKKDIPMQIASGQQWVNDVEYLLSTSFTKTSFLNYANYSNAEIDAIFEKSHTVGSSEDRLKLWATVEKILADDVPWIMLAQPNFNLPVGTQVKGWVQPVDGLFRLQHLSKS